MIQAEILLDWNLMSVEHDNQEGDRIWGWLS
jgi:hypothetical protein